MHVHATIVVAASLGLYNITLQVSQKLTYLPVEAMCMSQCPSALDTLAAQDPEDNSVLIRMIKPIGLVRRQRAQRTTESVRKQSNRPGP